MPEQHQWVVMPVYRFTEEELRAEWERQKREGDQSVGLDLEPSRLLSVTGPGCFKCQVPWSLDAPPCSGGEAIEADPRLKSKVRIGDYVDHAVVEIEDDPPDEPA